MNGSDDGVRRFKKYWNPFDREPVMQYEISPDGSLSFSLSNAPASQHLYLVDVFSYGLGGLDSPLPVLSAPSQAASESGAEPSRLKRAKVESSAMEGVTSTFSTEKLNAALPDPMDPTDEGNCKVITEMKLYFQDCL